jgi:dCMP deaminase
LRFLKIAYEVCTWSKDPSTKCGCVLVKDRRVIATGYNGFPANISDTFERYNNRDFKLAAVVHAEKNALFNAAKNGSTTEGCTAYITWPPCCQCASALIQAGVTLVVCPNPNTAPTRWVENFLLANELLFEAGVTVLYYSEEDLWTTEHAQPAAQNGLLDSIIGQLDALAMNSTLTPWSVADLKTIKQRLVSILAKANQEE